MARRYLAQHESINSDGYSGLHEDTHTYEHFPVVCPSCKGKGEICKDPSEMVTFIPVKDERLKPARTKLKIFFLVLFLGLCGGVAAFILYPRTVKIRVVAHSIADYRFNATIDPWIEYTFDLSVENNYYFPVEIKDVLLILMYQRHEITRKNFTETLHVGSRSSKKKLLTVNASYDRSLSHFLWKQCYTQRDYIGQVIRSTGELSYWMHTEHLSSAEDYFYMDCSKFIFPGVITTTHRPPHTITFHTINPRIKTRPHSSTSPSSKRIVPTGEIITYAPNTHTDEWV